MMKNFEGFNSGENESSEENLHKSFVDYLVGVSEEPNWQSEEQMDSVLAELANSRSARDKLREELAEFTSSPEGNAYVENCVAKYVSGERDSMSIREDVLSFLVRDVIDKKWADFLAQKQPDIYKPDEQSVKDGLKQDIVKLLLNSERRGLDRRLLDALPDGAIDFAHLDVEKITPVIEGFVGIVAEKMGLENVPEVAISVSYDEREKGYCHNTGSSSGGLDRISIDVNSHSSMAAIADALSHELFHRRQTGVQDYDAGGLAQKLYINRQYYIDPEVDYERYRLQLREMQAWYVGEQVGALFRADYLDRHPEKVAEMAEMYAKIENGEYDSAKVEDGFDAAYYRDARDRLARLQKQE